MTPPSTQLKHSVSLLLKSRRDVVQLLQ